MRKMLALLLAAVLWTGAFPAAGASGFDKSDLVEIVEYTWEEALEAIGTVGWQGLTYKLEDANLKYWAPKGLVETKLTEEGKQAGYLAYHISSDESLTMAVTRSGAVTTREDFIKSLEDYGAAGVRVQNINGTDWVLYEDANLRQKPSGSNKYGFRCLVAALPTEEGVVEFVFYIQSEVTEYVTDIIMASIEPIEK